MGTPNEEIPLEAILPEPAESAFDGGEDEQDLSSQIRSAMASAPRTPFGVAAFGGAEMFAFACEVEHEWDTGVRTAPRCGPAGTQQAAWRVHGGKCWKTVKWAAAALDGKPRAPHPEALVPNEVLVGCKVGKPVPGYLPSGTPIVTLKGEYRYELLKPPGPNDDLSAATSAMTDVVPALHRFRLSDFDRSLLAPGLSNGFVQPPGDLGALI